MRRHRRGRGVEHVEAGFHQPAQPKAGFDTSAVGRVWFAIWNLRRNLAVAIDAYPYELETSRQSLQSARRGWGDEFAGPFNARQQAETVAVEKLVTARKWLDTARQSGIE